MPPKKDNKKEVVLSEDDGSGVLKNIVQFKLNFEIVSQNLGNIVIMYEWLNAHQVERLDTGLIDQWNVIHTEQITEELSQITYAFEKIFDPIRFNEALAEILSTRKLIIYFINADDMKVLQEFQFDYSSMLLTPEFHYHFSKLRIMEILDFKFSIVSDKPLLHDQLKTKLNPFSIEIVSTENVPIDDMKSYELSYVKYQFFDGTVISTDPQVSMPNMYFQSKHVFLMSNLNVADKFNQILKIELHDKDEVVHNDLKQEVKLFDIEQWLQIEAEKEKPPEPVDQIDPKTGKKIPKKEDKKEAKKEVKKEVKKDAKKDTKKKEVKLGEPIREQAPEKNLYKNNHGIAAFNISAFLQANVREVDLLAQIVPRKQFEDTESRNLDLNTTAKRNVGKLFTATNYLDQVKFDQTQQATMYVKFEIAAPLVPKKIN